MGFDRGPAAMLCAPGLIASGAVAVLAWTQGMWGLLAGAALTGLWLLLLNGWAMTRPAPAVVRVPADADADAGDAMVLRVLLDSAPTPLLAVEGGAVRVLNRAARGLFATDDRVLPPPPALVTRTATHLDHEGRHWRIDRVDVAGGGRMVVALIDIVREERAAEARATAEMIQVLGHELLNGLSPIVSLAESGLAAVAMADPPPELLPEILGTLARRTEGLMRFTEAYRALARLPEPSLRPVALAAPVADLARLFEGRWPAASLAIDVDAAPVARIDRDQIAQALWAILQNAVEAGGPAARVTLSVRGAAGGVAIAIGDDGPGVAEGHGDRIFRPFHTTRPDGTGIGLSLARQIVQAHGGSLALLPGRPTTFRMLLPAER